MSLVLNELATQYSPECFSIGHFQDSIAAQATMMGRLFQRSAPEPTMERAKQDVTPMSMEEGTKETEALIESTPPHDSPSESKSQKAAAAATISRTGLMVLLLLAAQNCSKNLLMRFVMKDRPNFLSSAAVLGSECLKLTLSVSYILFVQKRPFASILEYLREDKRNTLLLLVPASAYNLQQSLEYVALANLDAAVFSVLVQTKLLFTASFAVVVLRKKLKLIQVISLVLLTCGVMLCNLRDTTADGTSLKGVVATLGIAVSSGFASVYTEKVIKGQGVKRTVNPDDYGLAYTQVQLALMSLLAIGVWAIVRDFNTIVEHGLFYNFTGSAFVTVVNSAMGGLIVASVLKYADSVLKGYATATSVICTGVLSMVFFGTQLSTIYFIGIVNVVLAVLLYNGKNLDQVLCQ